MPTNYIRQCVTDSPNPLTVDTGAIAQPNLLQRAKQYKSARDHWVEAGKPLRSDEEKAALFAICEACPSGMYDPKPIAPGMAGGKCKACGCGLAKERNVLNKIAWGTEDCPKGHWIDYQPKTET